MKAATTQKTDGALVIDIGAGTTDYILYVGGVVRQSGAFTVGGNMINHDICYHFRIPFALAEKLKIKEGIALLQDQVPPCSGTWNAFPPDLTTDFARKDIDREKLNQIIHLRLSETLKLIKRRIDKESDAIAANLFLTGGTSLLKGIGSLAEEVFQMPVHLAHEQSPADEVFKNPQFSTALGLLCHE